jgi:hypothetical protein
MHEITKENANEYINMNHFKYPQTKLINQCFDIRNRREKDSYLQNKEEARYEVNLPSTFVIKKRVLKVMYKYKIPRRTSIGLKSKKESQ